MSGNSGTCKECQGKFWPGLLGSGGICGTCEALLRLRLFVASGRCPGAVGEFIQDRVRECHRLILEEAERWWTAQPLPGSDSKGLQRVVKAPSPAGPPTASGGSREREPATEKEKKSQRSKEEAPPPRHSELRPGEVKEERAESSHRRHRRRSEGSRRRGDSRSGGRRRRGEQPVGERGQSHRPKKRREEEIPEPPRNEVKEEESEDTGSFEDVELEEDREPSREEHRSSQPSRSAIPKSST